MTTYLLDTNIVSDLVRNPQGQIAAHVRKVGEARIATSIVVAGELRYGAEKKASPKLSRQLEAILGALLVCRWRHPSMRFTVAFVSSSRLSASRLARTIC